MKKEPISRGSEWTFPLLEKYDQALARLASDFSLETYPNQIEVISSEQMIDAQAMIGMPINYSHWSFGKQFINLEKHYKRGRMGLAYEIVINSNPCIAYLMEENSMTMQALVIAHACYGHNSFFKNNYLFQTWTNADAIINYLLFAKQYIASCEERYGIKAVEETLDACHAIMNHGVDRYKRPEKLSVSEENARQAAREEYLQSQVNELWNTIPSRQEMQEKREPQRFPAEPEENILYFIEKHAPLLEPWQREIARIIRKIGQYFYPQKQTKVMNEGWACFWHYTLINGLYDEGLVTDEFMFEFLESHTSVIRQPDFDSPHYSGMNPYALGFAMMMDIKRICQSPTEEDKFWFPDLANTNWQTSLDFAMRNFKDESFIAQYLSPKVMRDLKLFWAHDNSEASEVEISAIHNEKGYEKIRQKLASNYNLSNLEPNIQVHEIKHRGDRSLHLHHTQFNHQPLKKNSVEVLKHLHYLWGFDVHLESFDETGKSVQKYECPQTGEKQ